MNTVEVSIVVKSDVFRRIEKLAESCGMTAEHFCEVFFSGLKVAPPTSRKSSASAKSF